MKNLSKQSNLVFAFYYIGKLLHYINMSCLLVSLVSLEAQGLYRGIHSTVFLLATIDLGEAVVRFFVSFKEGRGRASFLGWILVTTTLLYIGLVGLLLGFNYVLDYVGGIRSDTHLTDYFSLIFGMGYVVSLSVVLKTWYSVLHRIVWPNFLQEIVLHGMTSVTLLVYYVGWCSFGELLFLMMVPYVIHLGLMVGYLWWIGAWHIALDFGYLSGAFLRSFAVYSLFMVLPSKVFVMAMRIDMVMISKILGDAPLGVYANIITVALLLDIPLKVVKQSTSPLFAKGLARGAYEWVDKLYKRLTLRQVWLCCFMLAFLYAILPGLAPEKFRDVFMELFLVVGVAKVVNNLFSISSILLVLSDYFRLSVTVLVVFLVGLLINWWMIVHWELYGAAIGLVCLLSLVGLWFAFLVWYKMGIHPFSRGLLAVLVVTLMVVFLVVLVPSVGSLWVTILLRELVVLGVYGMFWCWGPNFSLDGLEEQGG